MNRRSFLKLVSSISVGLALPTQAIDLKSEDSEALNPGTIDAWIDTGPTRLGSDKFISNLSILSDAQAIIGNVVSTNILDRTHIKTPGWINIRTRDSFSETKKLIVSMWYGRSPEMDKNSSIIFRTVGERFGPGAWILRMPMPILVPKERFMGLWYELKD